MQQQPLLSPTHNACRVVEQALARCVLASILLGVCTGCSTIKTDIGTPIDLFAFEALPVGVATRSQVVAAYGPPLALAPQNEGVAFLYEHIALSEQQFGIGLSWFPYLPGWLGSLFKAVIGQDKAQHDAAVLFFDRHGILTAVRGDSWPELPGRGGALQFFSQVEPVVNVQAYLSSPLLLDWGYGMLDPLNEAQNRIYRAPIEMRGSPESTGQRSLEILRAL